VEGRKEGVTSVRKEVCKGISGGLKAGVCADWTGLFRGERGARKRRGEQPKKESKFGQGKCLGCMKERPESIP